MTPSDLININSRDKAVLIGLYLSRFDIKALENFGFTGFRQAYNVLGLSVGALPKSIQNYRDEFDPYYPNSRKGWHGRKLREYCKIYKEATDGLSFDEFSNIIRLFLEGDLVDDSDIIKERKETSKASMANRLITGKAAEEYFVMNYQAIDAFHDFNLQDTTLMGCGFDYKLSHENKRFYVEVKGINEKAGSVMMTEKEYTMADCLREHYCLFVVSNFKENLNSAAH